MPASLKREDLYMTRDYLPADHNFILASFLRGLYYGNDWFNLIPKSLYMEHYHAIIEAILLNPSTSVKIACLKEDPEVILGYAILRSPSKLILDWIFVKSAWRRIGIAKSLIPPSVVAVTHLTKTGKSLLPKLKNAVFNPFAI